MKKFLTQICAASLMIPGITGLAGFNGCEFRIPGFNIEIDEDDDDFGDDLEDFFDDLEDLFD